MSSRLLGEMRLGDLMTFVAVLRSDSISSAARELGVTPSQVSKAVARLEAVWGVRLLSRTSRGVTLSEAGRRARPHVEEALAQLDSVFATTHDPRLTVAAPSSLIEAFLPPIAASLPDLHVRGLVLPPPLLRADAGDDIFDATLLSADQDVERLPASWVSVPLGDLRQALMATKKAAATLGPFPVPVSALRHVPFVAPVFKSDGRFIAVEDDAPLKIRERVIGHEAQTIGVALALAACSDQLVFGPVVAAYEYLRAGRLVEVPVEGWDTRSTLYLACNGERVLARVQQAMVKALRGALAALDPPADSPSESKTRARRGRA